MTTYPMGKSGEGELGLGESSHNQSEENHEKGGSFLPPSSSSYSNEKSNKNKHPHNHHFKVERDKLCPMYLRLFTRSYEFHSLNSFSSPNSLPIEDELVIYTWPDATLKELSSLIKDVHPDTRRKGCSFAFRLIFQEPSKGQFLFKDVGIVYNDVAKRSKDDFISLEKIRFVQGDYIDVAIYDADNALLNSLGSSR